MWKWGSSSFPLPSWLKNKFITLPEYTEKHDCMLNPWTTWMARSAGSLPIAEDAGSESAANAGMQPEADEMPSSLLCVSRTFQNSLKQCWCYEFAALVNRKLPWISSLGILCLLLSSLKFGRQMSEFPDCQHWLLLLQASVLTKVIGPYSQLFFVKWCVCCSLKHCLFSYIGIWLCLYCPTPSLREQWWWSLSILFPVTRTGSGAK